MSHVYKLNTSNTPVSGSLDIVKDFARYTSEAVKRSKKVAPQMDIILSLPLRYSIYLGYPPVSSHVRKKIKFWNTNMHSIVCDYQLDLEEAQQIDGCHSVTFDTTVLTLKVAVENLLCSYNIGAKKSDVLVPLQMVEKCHAQAEYYSDLHHSSLRQVHAIF